WVGAFTTWALASLGVGTVLWLGRPCRRTQGLAGWLLADPPPFPDCAIHDYPFDVEYGPELEAGLGPRPAALLLGCAEDARAQAACGGYARRHGLAHAAGWAGRGGWFGCGEVPDCPGGEQDPVTALAVAALLVEAARQTLCPLPGDLAPA